MNAVSLLVGVKQVALLPGAIFPLLASVDPDGVFGACGGKVCAKSCVTAPFVFQIIGCLLVMTSIAKLVCAFGKQTERGGASFMPLTLGMVDGLVAHVCARFAETGTGGAIFGEKLEDVWKLLRRLRVRAHRARVRQGQTGVAARGDSGDARAREEVRDAEEERLGRRRRRQR